MQRAKKAETIQAASQGADSTGFMTFSTLHKDAEGEVSF
jgi:hypothetical protein